MELSLIYVTASHKEEALVISEKLVEERLIACANVLGGMTSVYRWEGKVQTSEEVSLLLKTRESLVEQVTQRVKELHSYECPCVISVSSTQGNAEFFSWVKAEVK